MENVSGNPHQPTIPPAYPVTPPIVYLQPGQQVVYVQQPVYVQEPGAYHHPSPRQVRPISSGLGIAAGVLGILLGCWSIFMFMGLVAYPYMPSNDSTGFVIFLHLTAALAVLALGIIMVIQHRVRSRPVPALLIGACVGLVVSDMSLAAIAGLPAVAIFAIIGSLAVIVVSVCVLFREAD
ncbi:hypothetical protein [Arthrobacter sp. zg-Y750]|uniref:hypothetical protein n=1 Tax=Arthrobacter sp. zg-Y750 TaxID=2894189 RepID=UPI001E3F9D96|nr:hypothetical protein [Arthrobacter sp. zg-Y750]MCC9176757.1 hypothetical protein [Arthrobacter sp. zg-Y750]